MADVRFGVRAGDQYSRHWVARMHRARAELYLAPAGAPWMHISFHSSGHWHIKILYENRERTIPIPEVEMIPGFHKLLQVNVSRGVARHESSKKPVQWVEPPDAANAVAFTFVLEWQGANRNESWPGKSHGSRLIARLPIPDGTSVAIIAEPLALPAPVTIPIPHRADVDRLIKASESTTLGAMVFGNDNHGAVVISEGSVSNVRLVAPEVLGRP